MQSNGYRSAASAAYVTKDDHGYTDAAKKTQGQQRYALSALRSSCQCSAASTTYSSFTEDIGSGRLGFLRPCSAHLSGKIRGPSVHNTWENICQFPAHRTPQPSSHRSERTNDGSYSETRYERPSWPTENVYGPRSTETETAIKM